MEFESWSSLALFLATVLVVGFKNNFQRIIDWALNRGWASQLVHAENEILQVIWSTEATNSKISRIAIFKAGNGGSKPKLGKEFKASMIYNSWDHPRRNRKTAYQGWPPDKHYLEMLESMIKNDVVKLVVEDMPKDSELRNFYIAEGVKYSEVYYITETSNYLYYMSLSTAEEGERFQEPTQRAAVSLCVSQIQRIFRKYPVW